MDASRYESLIREMCQAAGLTDVDSVLEKGHFAVDDHIVGLMHDEHDFYTNTLTVNVNLDRIAPAIDPEIYLRLLKGNASRREGHFGVHPETGHAMYRVNIDTGSDLSGAELARLIHEHVCRAAATFDELRL